MNERACAVANKHLGGNVPAKLNEACHGKYTSILYIYMSHEMCAGIILGS